MSDSSKIPINDQLVLISGESATGKSAALMNLRDPEGVMYLNCEAGKRLPFKNKFKPFIIIDPYEVYDGFTHALNNPDFHTIVIDSSTFLMDMFESRYIIGSADTMSGWRDYAQFFKNLMQLHVAQSDKSVLVLAHTKSALNEKTMEMNTFVPVKGSLANNGIEAYFSTVVSTKKMPLKALTEYESNLLNITSEDESLGYKHVFQTKLTKETVGERVRSPMGMFTQKQTYMDNDAQTLLDHLGAFYA